MSKPPLLSLVIEYFTRRGYEVKKYVVDEEEDADPNVFDLIVQKYKEVHPVRVKEWNRTVGVNMIISLDKAAHALSYSSPIMVADKFSDHAKAYASRRGIILLTRSEIMRGLM
ncbi:MAG: restriction endonuclease [Nitrososphaerota archaeon]|nr:restriction endonuclease [Candidatus Bathyarchaeota archaeon]MDW8048438.1 restriction endonuclease [Nitrososphaerota archaeon]